VCAGGGVYGQRLPPRPSSAVFREAQKYVRARLEKKWLPMFLETLEFKQRHMTVRQEGGRSSVSSAAGTRVYVNNISQNIFHCCIIAGWRTQLDDK